jgi:hypothetical protein
MDLVTMLLAGGLLAPVSPDSARPAAAARAPAGPVVIERFRRAPAPPQDSVFRYSAAYYKRLDIHRYASYAILPLFAFQYLAGSQLYDKGENAPDWAETGHPIAAAGILGLFAANSVTGVWNLWEGRKDPDRGKRPVIHALLMLTAEAGFVTTAILGLDADAGSDDARTHRAVAISSVGIATAGYLLMLLGGK